MASYGFIQSSGGGNDNDYFDRNTDGSLKAGSYDPYRGTSSVGTGGAPQYPSSDPYGGTPGSAPSAGSYEPIDFGAPGSGGVSTGIKEPPRYPPSGPGAGTAPVWSTPNYDGTYGQPPSAGFGTPETVAPTPIAMPEGSSNALGGFNDPRQQAAWQTWANAYLPAQIAQNNQSNTANELAYNTWVQQNQMQQTARRDRDQSALAWQGLGLQGNLAQEAANQWAAQFGREGQQYQQEFAYNRGQDDRTYGLEQQRNAIAEAQQQANAAYQSGQLTNTQYANEMARLKQVEDNAYRQAALSQEGRQFDRTFGLEQGAQDIDRAAQAATQAYQQGLISNQQYANEMERLSAQERLAFDETQLAQQATLTREQLENAYRTAVMNAVGRNQEQNVRFLRG